MSLDLGHPDLAPLLGRLRPYARTVLVRAGAHALRLHADAVTPEHVLSVLMDDPDCAAHAAALHAFADPPTISSEALAISPGLMVVASGSTLPFSPGAAAALARARSRSLDRPRTEVAPADLFSESTAALEEKVLGSLRAAGLVLASTAPPATDPPSTIEPALFKHFTPRAKRVLSAANRLAAGEGASAISPAHLLLACLAEDPEVAAAAGIAFPRARAALAGKTADDTPPRQRSLGPDPSLVRYLRGLGEDSDTLALLMRFLSEETPELSGILLRSKLTKAFLDRGRGAFLDPEEAQDPVPPRR